MTARVFVDTNVLVYRQDASEPVKQPRAARWIEHLWRSRSGRLSYQVLQELYVTVTHKLEPGLPALKAQQLVRDLVAWQPAAIDLPVMERAWALHRSHSLSWWDALIVSAAQAQRCSVLLTEDLQHGQFFDELRVVDPFVEPERSPETVLLG